MEGFKGPRNLENLNFYMKSLCLEPTIENGSLKVSLASKENVLSWSYGKVTKPETINYRTSRPEKKGLFAEEIFGPTRDYECGCGKYKRSKYKETVCDNCGVEVTSSEVRGERMGHVMLSATVVHPYFHRYLADSMKIQLEDLQKVIYCENYIVIEPGKTSYSRKQLIDRECYDKNYKRKGFVARTGGAALKEFLDKDEQKMVLEVIPVLPPDIRPLVPIGSRRFATAGVNDLYRRVINRSNRLERLKSQLAPELIIRNEQRMLQETVDALYWNGFYGRTVLGAGNRQLKSLTDELKDSIKKFWKKSCDYSSRGIAIYNSDLGEKECGVPRKILLELYEPLVISKLRGKGITHTLRSAKRIIKENIPVVGEALKEVISSRPLLLTYLTNATALWPRIEEIEAISLHPEAYKSLGLAMKGEKVALHLPLSDKAIEEASSLAGRVVTGNGKIESAFSSLVVDDSIDPLIDMVVEGKALPLSKLERSLVS